MIIIQKNFSDPYYDKGPIREIYPEKEKTTGHPYASTPEGNTPYWVDKSNYLSSYNLADNKEKSEKDIAEQTSDDVKSTSTSTSNNEEFTPSYPSKEDLGKQMEFTPPEKITSTPKRPAPAAQTTTPKNTPVVEEEPTPQVMPNESTKEGLSAGAKAGLAAAGVAAAGAAGYAAYKAWKKKKAKKAAVDAEVNEFLNNKFKTEK